MRRVITARPADSTRATDADEDVINLTRLTRQVTIRKRTVAYVHMLKRGYPKLGFRVNPANSVELEERKKTRNIQTIASL